MITIKILGPGCANCKRVEQVVRIAVADLSVEAEIVKVTDPAEMFAYDLISTPGLVINETLVSSGRIPTTADVTVWIRDAQAQ